MTTAHLDYDLLADLAEGLLDAELAVTAQEHLETCSVCRERSADLSHVSQLLAAAPIPQMPAEFTARLDEALAAAAAEDPANDLGARRRFRQLRFLPAAAAVIIFAGGGLAVGFDMLGPASGSDSANSLGPPVPKAEASAPASERSRSAPSPRFTASGTDYRRATLSTQVTTQLQRGNDVDAADAPSSLTGCVDRVGKNAPVLLVDQASYEGDKATVIVLDSVTGPKDVWIVGPGCSATETDLVDHLTAG